jgi:class 3 adenylate cyclase/streptogramin lyase
MAEQGVVTIMHADVEGSTELTTRLGDEVGRRTLDGTKRVVRERVETFGGRQIDAVGDAMMFTFTSTRQAIAGAIAVQRALVTEERERPEETLRVRIGLNVGEVLERDGHPFGAAVNAGARVMSKAAGGQIFASEMVVRLAGTMPGISFRDRGRHTFKGFDDRWRLYEVDWEQPTPPPRAPTRRARETATTARPSRRLLIALAAAAAAVAVLVAVLVLRRDDATPIAVPPNSVAVVNPSTNRVVNTVEGIIRPGPVAFGAGSIWVGGLEDRTLVRIDPKTRQIAKTISLPGTPDGIAVGAGAVWVVHGRLGTLTRVDPQFEAVVETIPLAGRSNTYATGGVAVGEGAVWAVFGDSTLARLDPSTNRSSGSVLVGTGPTSVVAAYGSVWVSNSGESSVKRFSPVTFTEGQPLDELGVGGSPTGLAAGETAIWVASPEAGTVSRIDPTSTASSVLPISVGGRPSATATGAGAVWVSEAGGGTLNRVDPATNEVVERIPIGNAPSGVAVGDGWVWVAVQAP